VNVGIWGENLIMDRIVGIAPLAIGYLLVHVVWKGTAMIMLISWIAICMRVNILMMRIVLMLPVHHHYMHAVTCMGDLIASWLLSMIVITSGLEYQRTTYHALMLNVIGDFVNVVIGRFVGNKKIGGGRGMRVHGEIVGMIVVGRNWGGGHTNVITGVGIGMDPATFGILMIPKQDQIIIIK
jgi:hypothetical protein